MDTRVFSVYNLARGAFLSSKVTAADGVNEPLRILKVLVSGLGLDKESGLWISPLSSIPSVPRLFPFDLLYLDRNQRVVESAEIVPGAEFPPYRREVASALILASRTLALTETGRGDRLIIGVADEIQREIAAAQAFDLEPVVAGSRSTAGKPKASFDKNGKEARPTASAVLAEPISPATTRLSDRFVPVVEPANTCAVAIDPPVSESPTEQSVGVIELEQGTEVASSKTIDEREAEAAASPIEGPSFSSTEQVSADAKSVFPEEGSGPSISDEEIEKEGRSRVVITGQHGGFEDLFSNWVDAPSSAWMPRNPRPGITALNPTASIAASPEKGSPEDESKASNAVQSKPAAEQKLAASSNAAVAPDPAISPDRSPESTVAPKITTTAVASSIPTTTAVPQAHPTTTFTAGALGMWRVSMPTAATPVGTVPSSGQARPASSVAEKGPAKAKETSGKENQPSFSKSAESELRSATASQITSGAEPSKVTEAAVGANSERKPLTEIGTRPELEQKAIERAERLAATTRSSVEKLQARQPQSPAAKVSVAPENTATPAKKVKVEPKAPVTANGAASTSAPSKAQSRPSTEGNGKPKIAPPPSLGARFKRWLNPVATVNGDRRRAHRRYVPGMVAHYYTGGSPKPHEVADISMTGFYLLTEDRWMPETMIQMTLQKPCAKGERKQSITILSRVVRRGSDGIAAQFVMPEDLNPLSHDIQPSQATDKFSLARFL